jgi:hypothetical protein
MDLHQAQLDIEQRAYDNSFPQQDRALLRAGENKTSADTKAGRYFVSSIYAPMVQPLKHMWICLLGAAIG